ncbi:hypothetical protein [Streptosporangium subroseum]|uniref:hypothetical protein n=1 Tax=Streptosporangium subroseum TaxID=106412 RepID=UPI00308FDE90|nr:hypothetical protein OHB15_28675 [Streptosporangium subroseum]
MDNRRVAGALFYSFGEHQRLIDRELVRLLSGGDAARLFEDLDGIGWVALNGVNWDGGGKILDLGRRLPGVPVGRRPVRRRGAAPAARSERARELRSETLRTRRG